MKLSIAAVLMLISTATPSLAHPGIPQQKMTAVIPEAEHRSASRKAPRQTRHVTSQNLGTIDLSQDFKSLKGRMLRARLITIEPGGSVAWHEHQQRPGVAYLLSGSLVEIRDEGQGERRIMRSHGDAVFENNGVRHGWKNTASVPATALVVDLIPER